MPFCSLLWFVLLPLCWIWVLGPISHPYTPGCEVVSSHTGGPLWEMSTPRGQLKWPRRSPKKEGMLNNQLKHQHLHSTPPSIPCPTTAGLILLCLQQTSHLGPAMAQPKEGVFYGALHSPVHQSLFSALRTFGSALWPCAALLHCDPQLEFHPEFPGLRLQPCLFLEGSGSGPGAFVG